MRLSVVVPTRDRAAYLRHSLRTVCEQHFGDVEVIVSDNCSADDTRDVVADFRDERIRYVRTPSRVSMTSNWEFALTHARGDYVTFLGDDDGLLRHSLQDASDLLAAYSPPALVWSKVEYGWPDVADGPTLRVPRDSSLFRYNGRVLLMLLAQGRANYVRLPMLYSGFVHRTHINALTAAGGSFFHSQTPDVYSGFALLSRFGRYLLSMRPFSVMGASGASTGLSLMIPDSPAATSFLGEMDGVPHRKMLIIPGSLTSSVSEALAQANETCFRGRIPINWSRITRRIVTELESGDPELRARGFAVLARLELPNRARKVVDAALERDALTNGSKVKPAAASSTEPNDEPNPRLANVFAASWYASDLLGDYTPSEAVPYPWLRRGAQKARGVAPGASEWIDAP